MLNTEDPTIPGKLFVINTRHTNYILDYFL